MKLFSLIAAGLAATTVAKADIPATHGMLIFGDKATYASHLPMFHHPHDYQAVMKVSFTSKQHGVLAAYQNLKAKGETLFTIAPETMDLSQVLNSKIVSFKAELFQGHFERGGKKLGEVLVNVETFIVNTKLNPSSAEQSEFSLFGEKGEYFAVHLINGKPSFDFVAQIKPPQKLIGGFCRTRACDPTQDEFLTDADLPTTVKTILTADKIPSPGHFLGSVNGTFSEVTKVIYAEQAELAH